MNIKKAKSYLDDTVREALTGDAKSILGLYAAAVTLLDGFESIENRNREAGKKRGLKNSNIVLQLAIDTRRELIEEQKEDRFIDSLDEIEWSDIVEEVISKAKGHGIKDPRGIKNTLENHKEFIEQY